MCRLAALLVAGAGVLLATPARAQTTVAAEPGLQGYVRSLRWFPVRITLTHQGQPARAEVRVRVQQGLEGLTETRLPERELRSGANEVHTIYLHPNMIYGGEPLTVDLYREGRLVNTLHPQVRAVNETDWLVVGIGGEATINLLTTVTLPARSGLPNLPGNNSGGNAHINVAVLEPAKVCDRWQGLQAANLVVLGNVSERDLAPEQLAALRDYVTAGGTLVVTGGANWNRLTTPFFADLLPVRVTGGRTLTTATGLAGWLAGARPPTGTQFAACAAAPRPGSEVLAREGADPLVVSGQKGNGHVVFVAFDPSAPPFRNWDGVTEFWKKLLPTGGRPGLIPTISTSDSSDQFMSMNGLTAGGRLAEAPYAIPQLDIPAFYIVALFLLAYVIVLVPVNYFFLKARDKKEYAWLTTPAIVAVFSFGAYLIGYGFKGGRTLVVKTGVIEAYSGQDSAPNVFYAGLFSPRKTGYDIQMAADAAGPRQTATALLSEPGGGKPGNSLQITEDDTQKIDGFSVDMWAMRVLKSEGLTRLGQGFSGSARVNGTGVSGTIRNDSPLSLQDCRLVVGNQVFPVADLPAGKQVTLSGAGQPAGGTGGLPSLLVGDLRGDRDEQRMKRAVLQPLCSGVVGTQGAWSPGNGPLLVGWVREPLSELMIDGRRPREMAATLLVVHLGGK